MTLRLYERVSTVKQNLDAQHPDLEHYATRFPDAVWYTDRFTGRTLDRPRWSSLEHDLRPGDTVVIWRLDRLGRTARGLMNLFEQFEAKGVRLVSLRDGIDTTPPVSPTTRLLLNMLASIAQFETEIRAERIAAGIAERKRKGTYRPSPGRRSGACHKTTPEVRKSIRDLKAAGNSAASIARTLGLARNTVGAVLRTVTVTA